jgi:hypothetical protein
MVDYNHGFKYRLRSRSLILRKILAVLDNCGQIRPMQPQLRLHCGLCKVETFMLWPRSCGCEHLLNLGSRFVILSRIAVKWSGWLASIAVVVAPQSRHNFICCWELWSNVADAASIAFAWRWRRHKKLDVAIEIIVAFLHFLTYFISFPI